MELSKKELEIIIGCMSANISEDNAHDYLNSLGFSDSDVRRLATQNEYTFESLDYDFIKMDKFKDDIMKKLVNEFLGR